MCKTFAWDTPKSRGFSAPVITRGVIPPEPALKPGLWIIGEHKKRDIHMRIISIRASGQCRAEVMFIEPVGKRAPKGIKVGDTVLISPSKIAYKRDPTA